MNKLYDQFFCVVHVCEHASIHAGCVEHMVVKCDLSECMLDPAMLPMFEAHFVSCTICK